MLAVAGSPTRVSPHGHPGAHVRAKHPWSRPVSALDPPKPAAVSGSAPDKHRPYSALTAPPQCVSLPFHCVILRFESVRLYRTGARKKAEDDVAVPSTVDESLVRIPDPTAYSKQNIKDRLARERARAQAFKVCGSLRLVMVGDDPVTSFCLLVMLLPQRQMLQEESERLVAAQAKILQVVSYCFKSVVNVLQTSPSVDAG
jgi:hypothetical protein